MKKSTSIRELKETILSLEIKQANDWHLLNEQFHTTYESLKPINVIKNTFKEAIATPDLKANIANAAIGLTTGFVAKKVFTGMLSNPLTKLLGFIVEVVVANKVAKNADGIKSIGSVILKKIINQYSDSKKA